MKPPGGEGDGEGAGGGDGAGGGGEGDGGGAHVTLQSVCSVAQSTAETVF